MVIEPQLTKFSKISVSPAKDHAVVSQGDSLRVSTSARNLDDAMPDQRLYQFRLKQKTRGMWEETKGESYCISTSARNLDAMPDQRLHQFRLKQKTTGFWKETKCESLRASAPEGDLDYTHFFYKNV